MKNNKETVKEIIRDTSLEMLGICSMLNDMEDTLRQLKLREESKEVFEIRKRLSDLVNDIIETKEE